MHSVIDLIKAGAASTVDIDVNEKDVFYFFGGPSEYGHNVSGRRRTTLEEYTDVHASIEALLLYWGYSPRTLVVYKVQGFQKGDLLQPVNIGKQTYVTPAGASRNLIISDLVSTPAIEPPAAWPKAPAAAAPQFKAPAKEQSEGDSLLKNDQRSHSDKKSSRLCC